MISGERTRAVLAEAARVLALERPDPAAAFVRLRTHLLDTWTREHDVEGPLVDDFERRWPSITAAAFQPANAFDGLFARLDLAGEPAALDVDLLGIIGRVRSEVLHTQAIGGLLRTTSSVPLQRALFVSFVELCTGEAPADSVVAGATVETEVSFPVGPRGRWVRPDLCVRYGDAVLLIENKIDATDHDRQLDDYAECDVGVTHLRRQLCFLTPDGRGPQGAEDPSLWIRASYRRLAIAWRRVLARAAPSAATELLRLYLATITREICGIRISAVPSRATKMGLVPYLRAALGEEST